MDESQLFYVSLVLRYMDIFGAIALMGATIFMRFALLPTLKELKPELREEVHQGVRARWAKMVGLASGLLLLSGIANLGLAARYDFKVPGDLSYNMLGGIKLVLALPIFVLAALLMGKTSLAKKVQANAATVLNINLIGGWLKFSTKELKEKYRTKPVPPASAALLESPTLIEAR
jgi:hypothetical protein